MKVISIYELLGLIKDGKAPKKVRRVTLDFVKIYKLNSHTAVVNRTYENKYNDEDFLMDIVKIDDEVEIIEDEIEDIEELDVALLGQCDNWLISPTNEVIKQDIELNPYIIDNIRENTLEIQHKINKLIKNQKIIINKLKEEDKQ